MHIYLYMSGNFILYVDYKKIIKVTKKSKINVELVIFVSLKIWPQHKKKKKKEEIKS